MIGKKKKNSKNLSYRHMEKWIILILFFDNNKLNKVILFIKLVFTCNLVIEIQVSKKHKFNKLNKILV